MINTCSDFGASQGPAGVCNGDPGTRDSAMSEPALNPARTEAPTASIVVTTFQRHAMLDELLSAMCPQTIGRPVEVIVIDNCPDSSAEAVVASHVGTGLRYIRELRGGVVHARNRGVSAARGDYVIFLDDDEVPGPHWLDVWLAQADGRTEASFGRIVPRLLGPCPEGLLHQVERTFGRDLDQLTGKDVSRQRAHLGTGNAMFHRERCLGTDTPFDERFNERGGEDVWLITRLTRDGYRLSWNHEAVVEELVPQERMTLESLELRRFNQGQIRCILAYGDGGLRGAVRAAGWMFAGALQFLWFRMAWLLADLLAPRFVPDLRCRASGGLGKLLWRQRARVKGYGGKAA